jgi:hypothetical protein
MSNQPIIDATAIEQHSPFNNPGPKPARARRRVVLGALAIPLALGAAGLSLAQTGTIPPTPIAPTAIGSLATSREVAAKGEVAEIYGNKFIVQDGTGRALVETGRRGESGTLVKAGETVMVQGRFEHGFLHAAAITHADGSQVLLGPAGGPPRGGPGPLAWVKDKVGLGPKFDVPAMTATVERAGYSDVRVLGSGPRHLEVAAKGQDGRERVLHVDVDGRVRER